MSCQEMKHERLICVQTNMDVEVYLCIVRALTRNQKTDISEVSEVSL